MRASSINITGSNISANTDITLAAMNDINLLAATETYQETHRREEVTNGLISGGSFGFTVGQDKQTAQTDIEGATQSQSRSRLGSTAGNILLLSGGNTLIAGSDLTATQGALTATAGGGIGIFAGLDSLKQYTESHHDQDTGLFSKQRRTTTDTLIQSKYTGSTLAANNIELDAGADLVLQAAKLTGTGNTHLSAAGDLQLLSVSDILYSKHTETLQTDGVDLLNPGAAFADRRKINQTTRQTQTAQVTEIQSGGNLSSRSGGNTLVEAGKLNAGGNINLNAGYDANGNLLNSGATLTFAAVKDSDYLNTEDKHSSLSWQSQSGSGHNTENIRLANIKVGKGINVNATGGVMVDIPVPKSVAEAAPQVDENGKPLLPPPPLTPEELAARHKADLNKQLDTLATQPGQEWIGQLAKKAKEKPDQFKFREVAAAAEHWNYSQEGLTPEAAAVIAIAVTYGTAGVAGSAAGSMTGAAAGTTTVASAAVAAGMTTLASQATISLINNKGHVGKTLEELGRKESVKQVVAGMLAGGVGGYYSGTYNLESLAAKTATGCAAGKVSGSGCEQGAAIAGVAAGLAMGWEYTKEATDKLKLLECAPTDKCFYDKRDVLLTDGARTVDWTNNPDELGNWLTNSGMAKEGDPHIYDNTPWLRNFIVDVSKAHDWFNSWNYNWETGQYASQGVWGDSLFQLYSFGGMPIAGALTGLSYLDRHPYLPYLLLPPKKKDKIRP